MTHCYRKLLFFLSLNLMFAGRGVLASPLIEPITDPLIPEPVVERPLSPLEMGRIERKAEELLLSGQVQWLAQMPELAFEDWFRHLRLLQVLPDRQAEIESLGNIGAIAWENNRVQDARDITARLDVIGETEFAADGVLLLPLAEAYQQLRNSDQAIALYRTHVATLDEPYQAEIWRIIAQLSVDWFDYEQGVEAYENIQNLSALTILDREQFAKLYEKLGKRTEAIAVQLQLASLYREDLSITKLANVYLAIAANYAQLGQYQNAILFNESAFTLAWSQKQFAAAEAALNNLAQVYLAKDNLDFAIQVYEQLLIVQNTSYNRFGMMETYDHLGKLYQQKPLYPEALISYQKGLAIAKELNHNISLFTQAIETLTLNEIPIQ